MSAANEAIYTTTLPGLVVTIDPADKVIIDGHVVKKAGKRVKLKGGEFYKSNDPVEQMVIESKPTFGKNIVRVGADELDGDGKKQVENKVTSITRPASGKLHHMLEGAKPKSSEEK